MHSILDFLRAIFRKLKRERQHRIAGIVLALLFAGGACFSFAERVDFTDSLWWAVVTMTTVGYGDISPGSAVGKLVGVTLMLTGIGFLGLFTATIASVFVENGILENKGMKAVSTEDHFVICGWNAQGEKVLKELAADSKLDNRSIVLLAKLEEKPVSDEQVLFVRGDITEETIQKTALNNACTVILLADDAVPPEYSAAKTVMDILHIRSHCPSVYICAELTDSSVMQQAQKAGADEIILADELRTNMLVQAALDHGITEMVSELVSNTYGNELYKFPLPEEYAGKPFFEALCGMKKDLNVICLGIQRGADQAVITNPHNELTLEQDDQLLVVAKDRTYLTRSGV